MKRALWPVGLMVALGLAAVSGCAVDGVNGEVGDRKSVV